VDGGQRILGSGAENLALHEANSQGRLTVTSSRTKNTPGVLFRSI
jgi:hypothetical protein